MLKRVPSGIYTPISSKDEIKRQVSKGCQMKEKKIYDELTFSSTFLLSFTMFVLT
jgi:hypothetical protein